MEQVRKMVIAIFLFVIGAFAVAAGVNMVGVTRRAQAWPQTAGRIIERGVGEATTTASSRAGRYYEPRVKYTYNVAGTDYTGTRIDFNRAAYNKDSAEKRVAALPEQVQVHYDPQSPAESVLHPGSAGLPLVMVAFGALLALAGAGMVVSQFMAKRG